MSCYCYGNPNPVVNILDEIANSKKYPSPFADSPLLPLLIASLATQKHTPLTRRTFRQEYDYIVVGAGPGGSVVANRLSNDGKFTVLVLEAGGDPPLLSDITAIPRSFIESDVDWKYRTVPQQYTGEGMVNKQIPWPSGKALGGSSIMNVLVYLRGSRKNFDGWAAGGATGWSYNDVFRYFLKSEDNQNPDIASNGYHAVGGPLTISRSQDNPDIKKAVQEAADQMGYPFVDANGAEEYGFNDFQGTIRRGQRCSAAKAFLVSAENRRNLDIVSDALVTKVVIRNRKAVAVQVRYQGRTSEVRAKREIILSAGTVATPQLLMLSGVGPRSHLQSMGIPVLADLPVGQNLQDHVGTFLSYELNNDITPFPKRLADAGNILKYINFRTGPLSSPEGVPNMALLNNDRNKKTGPPNYALYFIEPSPLTMKDSALQFGLTPEVYEEVYAPYANTTNYACYIEIFDPKSRGTLKLNSTDITDQPLIDPQYFKEETDIENMVSGLKTCIEFGESEPLRKIGSKTFTTSYPGCRNVSQDIDKYLACVARQFINPAAHYVGTCKMGNPADPTTVVDPELRVKGIAGLRVVDASIMPTIVTANTQAAVYMIAEKASDMIRKASTTNIINIQIGK